MFMYNILYQMIFHTSVLSKRWQPLNCLCIEYNILINYSILRNATIFHNCSFNLKDILTIRDLKD